MDILSGVGTGRVCVYDPETRETKTLLKGRFDVPDTSLTMMSSRNCVD